MIFGGGIPLRSPDGMIVGAVGVSGAPDPAADVACAERAMACWEERRAV